MKFVVLLNVVINFLSLLHFSTEQCTEKKDCLKPNLKPGEPLEIGIMYDIPEDGNVKALMALHNIACEVIGKFPGSLTFRRYPGATVVNTDKGIICSDGCFRDQENACYGLKNPDYFKKCDGVVNVLKSIIEDCVYNCESNQILIDNGALRCSMGIPDSKIPALIFNKTYDPCHQFTSADQLKDYLCTTYGSSLNGCPEKKNN